MEGLDTTGSCPVRAADCPAEPYEFIRTGREVLTGYRQADELQRKHSAFWATEAQGYWVLTGHDAILDALQRPELFSSSSVFPHEPDPFYRFIPTMLDPPEHTAWRQLLAPAFSPGAIGRLAPHLEERCVELIEGIALAGACDFVHEFAVRFPGTVFLEVMGLPGERLDEFLAWMTALLHTSAEDDPDSSRRFEALIQVTQVFMERIAELRSFPELKGDDLLSQAVTWEIDGAPIPDGDLLSFCQLMFMAGLDTVTSQLSYMFFHLAKNPDDRRLMATEPDLIPGAVEELLRAFPIVQPGRKVVSDTVFHDCQMQAGEMVLLPLACAGRDPDEYPNADVVDLRRPMVRNLTFGAGPHRCIGVSLARQELSIALREWHRRIPDYQLVDESAVVEHLGPVYGIDSLPLHWNPGKAGQG